MLEELETQLVPELGLILLTIGELYHFARSINMGFEEQILAVTHCDNHALGTSLCWQ